MEKTKLTHNLIIVIPILLALVVVCGIIYINWNKSNEGFTNTEPKKQIDNLIATSYTSNNIKISKDIDTLQQKGFDNPDTNNDESILALSITSFTPTYKRTIKLEDVYVIKQIHLTGVTGDFRIGIKNTARNKISYVSGLELHHDAVSKV